MVESTVITGITYLAVLGIVVGSFSLGFLVGCVIAGVKQERE